MNLRRGSLGRFGWRSAAVALGVWLAEGRADWGTYVATAVMLLALTAASRRAPAGLAPGSQ